MTAFEETGDAGGATRHSYPAAAMVGDYLRTAAGLVPVTVLFATMPLGAVPATLLGGFGAVFAVFGMRTLLRHGTSIEMSETGLRASGVWQRTIHWDELDRMKLAYYSTRRDRKSGWMQLEIGAGGARLSLDSRIVGFDQVVRRAAIAAASRRLPLSEATSSNLEALGVRLPEPGDWQ
jgi:hypothetical protein